MEVMTKEYCARCPFFLTEKGWMEEDNPYWKEHPEAECMCKTCPRRAKCEEGGPQQDLLVCFEANKSYLDKKVAESIEK